MIEIEEKKNCCGCYACYNVCPVKAITMEYDNEGFFYPIVNKEKCIGCGMCKKVCPIINNQKKNNKPKAYACINKNEKIRKDSSSGGIFTLIAEYILNKNGVVFGAGFDENFNVIHSYVEDVQNLQKFRGAKYVQSKIGDTYKQAKKFLDDNRYVLFTGTPCQIEGLYSYLQNDYERLYTQDIICHGVPSPKVWTRYIEHLENKERTKIKYFKFRDKTHGWENYNLKIEYNNKKIVKEYGNENLYMKTFIGNLSLRPSCYDCKFKSKKRNSDITLADFWGIKNIVPSMYDNKGTSLVITNSEKGKDLLKNIDLYIEKTEVDLEDAIKYNVSMIKSCEIPKNRNTFIKDIEKQDFVKTVNRNICKTNIIYRILRKIKKLIYK